MKTNPWLVDSIKAFSFLNCPECAFRTKEENLFAYHAAKNHPLSSAFYDKQIEREKSSIGLETVEYSPELETKVEAMPATITNKSSDPLECIDTSCNEILAHKEQLKIHHSFIHDYEDSLNIDSLEDFDENFENDYENTNSGTDEAHLDFDEGITDESIADKMFADEILADEILTDESISDTGNSVIKDELSQFATQTVILKNPVNVKKLQKKRRKVESKPGPCTICGKLYDTERMKRHIHSAHTPNPMPDPNSNYEVVVGERENTKLYAKDGFLYLMKNLRVKQAYLK